MSERDVEIARRVFAEFQAGLTRDDAGAAFDTGSVASDAKWILANDAPGIRTEYVGREGFKEFMETWTEDFDWSVELERVVDIAEGRVVVESIQRALGKASGVPVELPVAAIWTLEGDQVVRIENYFDREEALAAARRPD